MAQIDKIQVQSTTYDIAQSSAATFTGTSNDTATPTGWSDVNVLQNTETNGSIFTKISKMFANIRWLYNQLGTTDYSATGASTVSAALSALQSGKAASSHSHGVSDLPVTDQQNNSNSTIPTSALIYSMNQTLTSLNDAYNYHVVNHILANNTYSSLAHLINYNTSNHGIGIYWFAGSQGYSDIIDIIPEYSSWYRGIFVSQSDQSACILIMSKSSVYYFNKQKYNEGYTCRVKI